MRHLEETMEEAVSAGVPRRQPDDDVAFLEVSQPQTGVAIQRVTGGERLGIGPPPAGPVVVTGYPADRDSPGTKAICPWPVRQ